MQKYFQCMQHIEFALDNLEIPETYQISKEFKSYVETTKLVSVDLKMIPAFQDMCMNSISPIQNVTQMWIFCRFNKHIATRKL